MGTDTLGNRDGLDELLKRMTISFPIFLTADEIEGPVFNYLVQEKGFNIDYEKEIKGHKRPGRPSEIYTSRFKGNITTSSKLPAQFKIEQSYMHDPYSVFFTGMKFIGVPGYNNIEDFKTLPSGEDQLKTIDETREAVDSYFSQRPK